jgi:hypothetical protein
MERDEGVLSVIERLSSGQVHRDAGLLIEHEQQYAGLWRSGLSDARFAMNQTLKKAYAPALKHCLVRVTETTANQFFDLGQAT